MRKIQKEEQITKVITLYVSIDGKEFENEEDCKAWEKSYRGTLEMSIKTIKKVNADAYALGLCNGSCDDEVWVLKPNNLNEVVLINAYIDCVTGNNGQNLTADMIGKGIALNFGYDRDYCDVYVLEDHIKSIEKAVANLINELDKED